jgi:hypothetical protein
LGCKDTLFWANEELGVSPFFTTFALRETECTHIIFPFFLRRKEGFVAVIGKEVIALIGAKKALEGRLAKHGLNPEDIFSDNAKLLFK